MCFWWFFFGVPRGAPAPPGISADPHSPGPGGGHGALAHLEGLIAKEIGCLHRFSLLKNGAPLGERAAWNFQWLFLHHANSGRDGLFVGFFAVFVYVGFVLLAVGQAARAADAAAYTGHALDKVAGQEALGGF